LATLRIPMFNKLNELLNGDLLVLLKATQTTDRESAEFDKCEFDWDIYNERFIKERAGKGETLVVSNTRDAFTMLKYKHLNGTKIVFWIGETEQTYKFRTNTLLKKCFKYFVYKQIDFFACYSQETIKFLENKYNIDVSKKLQIPQSIEYDAFIKDKKYSEDGKIRFLVISRLIRNKFLLRLIDEFILLQRVHKNITLDIYGKGEDESQIRESIQSIDFIKLNSFVGYSEVPNIYNKYDYFIMQTVEDIWGLTVNEAIASKLGILVSKYAPAREMIVHDETGYIYNPYDSYSYKNAIEWAIIKFNSLDGLTEDNYIHALDYYNHTQAAQAYCEINTIMKKKI
jgi:glycosyltransferase involved in cell wall biosynthesis